MALGEDASYRYLSHLAARQPPCRCASRAPQDALTTLFLDVGTLSAPPLTRRLICRRCRSSRRSTPSYVQVSRAALQQMTLPISPRTTTLAPQLHAASRGADASLYALDVLRASCTTRFAPRWSALARFWCVWIGCIDERRAMPGAMAQDEHHGPRRGR